MIDPRDSFRQETDYIVGILPDSEVQRLIARARRHVSEDNAEAAVYYAAGEQARRYDDLHKAALARGQAVEAELIDYIQAKTMTQLAKDWERALDAVTTRAGARAPHARVAASPGTDIRR